MKKEGGWLWTFFVGLPASRHIRSFVDTPGKYFNHDVRCMCNILFVGTHFKIGQARCGAFTSRQNIKSLECYLL